MKYKVGDHVTVVDQETLRDAMILHGHYPGYADTDAYGRFCGQTVTIAEIDGGGSYLIEEYLEKAVGITVGQTNASEIPQLISKLILIFSNNILTKPFSVCAIKTTFACFFLRYM